MKVDFHVHTNISIDGVHRPREMVKRAKKAGLDAIAITDHNQLFSWNEARRLSREFGVLVIPGIEGGNFALEKHWIGLAIRERPKFKKIFELPEMVTNENGVAVAPHPYTRLGYEDYVDLGFKVVEAFNGTEPGASNKVTHIRGISEVAGSDAHAAPMLGFCWTWIDNFETIDDILEALRKGFCFPQGKRTPVARCLHHYGAYFTYRILGRPIGVINSLYHMVQDPARRNEGDFL